VTLPGDPASTSPTDEATVPAAGPSGPDAGSKAQVRRALRASRSARTADERAAVASALAVRVGSVPEVAAVVAAGGGVVAAYASLGDEPGTGPLRELLALSGIRVLLPVIRDDGSLCWGWDSDDLVPRDHRLAIPEPPVDAALPAGAPGLAASGCAVLLIPALGVDTRGYRLGQGGGYYDRLLAQVPAYADGGPLRVAVVHDDEVLDLVPHDSHDQPVDAVLTATMYRRLDRA
jgi:5-formyltetrahydrofolate cyclo-ligase